jgi:glycerate kinase
MNRSKIIGATALATVMTAGAAQAEMSIGGFVEGYLNDGGNGMSQAFGTNSLYVTYSDSLDIFNKYIDCCKYRHRYGYCIFR